VTHVTMLSFCYLFYCLYVLLMMSIICL